MPKPSEADPLPDQSVYLRSPRPNFGRKGSHPAPPIPVPVPVHVGDSPSTELAVFAVRYLCGVLPTEADISQWANKLNFDVMAILQERGDLSGPRWDWYFGDMPVPHQHTAALLAIQTAYVASTLAADQKETLISAIEDIVIGSQHQSNDAAANDRNIHEISLAVRNVRNSMGLGPRTRAPVASAPTLSPLPGSARAANASSASQHIHKATLESLRAALDSGKLSDAQCVRLMAGWV